MVIPSSSFISDAIENGMNAIFKEIQDKMGVTDGGVAGQHYASLESDNLRAELLDYFTQYAETEMLYGPDTVIAVEMAPEGYGSPYNDPNYLLAARQVEAAEALRSYSFMPYGGLDNEPMFQRRAGEKDELVANLSLGFAMRTTHTMVVEFAPLTPDVVHVQVKELEDVLIASGLVGAIADEY